jgi:ankyrin repeat protein
MTASSQSAISQQSIDEFVGVAHGNFARVKELLAQHPDMIDASATWVERPIQAAAHVGSIEIARFLLDHGAPLDIFTAAMLGMMDEVKARIQGDLAGLMGVHGFPVMYFPALHGHLDIAELLKAHGAGVNGGNGANTPLHGAVVFQQVAMARWLLDRGADLASVNYEQKTPLQLAQDRHLDQMVTLLKDYMATA